jgi:hypothetical protein
LTSIQSHYGLGYIDIEHINLRKNGFILGRSDLNSRPFISTKSG